MQTNNISGHCLFHGNTLTGFKTESIRDTHILAGAHMLHFHALGIFTRADTHKSNTISVFGVHIGLDLKYKAAKFIL